MRLWQAAAIAGGISAVVATASFGAYAMDTKARTDRWLSQLQFEPRDPGEVKDTCRTLAIDSLDFEMPGNRGDSGDFKFRSTIDSWILTATFGERFCSSYARLKAEDLPQIRQATRQRK